MPACRKTIPTRSNNMSELLTDAVESEVEQPVIANPDDGAELATASESEHSTKTEPVDEVESEASKQQAYINKQYGTIKQSERDLAAANDELAKFRKADIDRQAAAVKDIPPMPDQFDDDFAEKVKLRDEAIVAQTKHNTTVNNNLQQEQFNQQQQAQAKQEAIQKSAISYTSKANELGINQEELQAAGNTVASYGLSDDLVMHILADSDGPLITKHLAANPQEGFELANLSPFAVGQFLEGIKQKASALKPKTSNTVDPVETLKGASVTPTDGYKNIGGAKFY